MFTTNAHWQHTYCLISSPNNLSLKFLKLCFQFTLEMMPSVEDQKTELGKSYPWMSTKKSGLQPVVAAKVEFQPDKGILENIYNRSWL